MTNADEAWRIGKSRQYRRLALSGLGVKEIVHYANGKHPEAELILKDGRKIELAIGDLEFAAEEPLRVTAERHGDSTYLVRYTGPAVENADIAVFFNGGTWQEEFDKDLDRWIESGYTEDLNYVVDARIMARTA
ncbi:hypothetical protein [Glycomyces paridis]|uniref:Uncharacterized protein n=1 Tax=Glycomyces paridis TaxID=2126555 RepID=A0A4S8P6T3_9ACTN|nr:hypothetical protein [Glycomyces paridis]THV24502.1 hypothetical protein E9998_21035 [Glycomyces paridis]